MLKIADGVSVTIQKLKVLRLRNNLRDQTSFFDLHCQKNLTKFVISVVEVTNLEVQSGTASTLSCTVTGITEPVTITWSGFIADDNNNFVPETEFRFDLGKQIGKLTVSAERVTEDKTYTCTISGESESSPIQTELVYLDVYGK